MLKSQESFSIKIVVPSGYLADGKSMERMKHCHKTIVQTDSPIIIPQVTCKILEQSNKQKCLLISLIQSAHSTQLPISLFAQQFNHIKIH